ncbi:MAG: adenylate kinase [Acidimicrobiales bacterium]|jgi:adenylate kinase
MVVATRLVILGKQGAGKGTQSTRLSHHFAIPHISTGDMLRAAAKSGSEFGQMAKRCMDQGELVPDEVITGVVGERLHERDALNRGFLLDGFPRTTGQADSLEAILAPFDLDLVIDLEVPTELVLKRLASRRVCTVCGANYSLVQRPKHDWICDVCGGEVVQREDDTEQAIKRRLDLYESETAPLVAYYEDREKLVSVNGVGEPEEVMARLINVIHRRRGGHSG